MEGKTFLQEHEHDVEYIGNKISYQGTRFLHKSKFVNTKNFVCRFLYILLLIWLTNLLLVPNQKIDSLSGLHCNHLLKITTHKKLYSYLVRHGRGATKAILYDIFGEEKIRATNEIITTFLLSLPSESDKRNKESKLRLQLIVSTMYNSTTKMIHKHSLRTIVHIFGILS